MSRTKFKDYLEYLYLKQDEFSKKYKIYIDRKFDPRKYFKSILSNYRPLVHAVLVPSKELIKSWEDFIDGKSSYIYFYFIVYSEGKDEKYDLNLKYVYSEKKNVLYPLEYSHKCPFSEYYGEALICKHVYAGLRELDKFSYINQKIPIARSTFIPKDSRLLKEYEKIEKEKISPLDKVKKTFEIMEEYLYLKELEDLETLNIRLKYLRKV